jgi:hypothetical protein
MRDGEVVEALTSFPAPAGVCGPPIVAGFGFLGFRVGHPRFDVHRTSLQHAVASVKGEKCLRERVFSVAKTNEAACAANPVCSALSGQLSSRAGVCVPRDGAD